MVPRCGCGAATACPSLLEHIADDAVSGGGKGRAGGLKLCVSVAVRCPASGRWLQRQTLVAEE